MAAKATKNVTVTYKDGTSQTFKKGETVTIPAGKTVTGITTSSSTTSSSSSNTVTVSNGKNSTTITVSSNGTVTSGGNAGLSNTVTGGSVWVGSDGKVYSNGVYTGYSVVTQSSSSGGGRGGGGISIPAAPIAPIAPTTETKKPVNKLEYIYGIRDIKIEGTTNEKFSSYVSKPITVQGNIAQISLDTKEMHPVFNTSVIGISNSRHTSVEYYISYNDGEWLPILPSYEDKVINELLFIVNNEAICRFSINDNKIFNVYENGVLYDSSKWQINPSKDGVIFTEYNQKLDYTIDYYPNENISNPYIIGVINSNLTPITYKNEFNEEGEVFSSADINCSVTLSYTPYINYEVINADPSYNPNISSYRPIAVYLEKGTIAIPTTNSLSTTDHANPYDSFTPTVTCTKNMTDYKATDDIPELSPYNLKKNLAFEYYQNKNKIVFTETFMETNNIENNDVAKATAQIRVKYAYLVSHIRVKAILRRTGNSRDAALTPVIEEYTLKIKTLE